MDLPENRLPPRPIAYDQGATPYDHLVEGGKDDAGEQIKSIIGQHRHMTVYITAKNNVVWHYNQLPERLRPVVSEYQSLKSLAESCLSSKAKGRAARLLASALYGGLLSSEGKENAMERFTVVRNYIQRKSEDRARLYYVMLSLLVAAVFLVLSAWLFTHILEKHKLIGIGFGGGVIGAAISIIQRGWKLAIDPFDSVANIAAMGFVRIVPGGVFGTVLVVLSKANLAFGNFTENTWALFGLSIAAGISERLVPDLLERSAVEASGSDIRQQ